MCIKQNLIITGNFIFFNKIVKIVQYQDIKATHIHDPDFDNCYNCYDRDHDIHHDYDIHHVHDIHLLIHYSD